MIPSIPSILANLYLNKKNQQQQEKKKKNQKYFQLNLKKIDDKNLNSKKSLYSQDSLLTKDFLLNLTNFPIKDVLEIMKLPKEDIEEGATNLEKSNKFDLILSNKYLAISISLKRLKEKKEVKLFIENITTIFSSHFNESQIFEDAEKEIVESMIFVLSNKDFIYEINSIIPSKTEMESIYIKINTSSNCYNEDSDDNVYKWLYSLCQIKDIKIIFNLLENVLSTENLQKDIKKWSKQIENNVNYIVNCNIIKSFTSIVSMINDLSSLTSSEEDDNSNLINKKIQNFIDFNDCVKKVVSFKQSKKLFKKIASYMASIYTQDLFPNIFVIEKLIQDISYILYIPKIHIEFNQIENSLFDINIILQNKKFLLNILNSQLLTKVELQLKDIYQCLDCLTASRNSFLEYFLIEIDYVSSIADESFMNRNEIESVLSIRNSNWIKFKCCYDSVILLYKELSLLYKSLSFKQSHSQVENKIDSIKKESLANDSKDNEKRKNKIYKKEEKEKDNKQVNKSKVDLSLEDKENKESRNVIVGKERSGIKINQKLDKIKKIDNSKSIKNLHISAKY